MQHTMRRLGVIQSSIQWLYCVLIGYIFYTMIYYGLNLSTLADFALDVVVIFLLFCFVVITAPTTPAPVTTSAPGPMPDISKFLSCSS